MKRILLTTLLTVLLLTIENSFAQSKGEFVRVLIKFETIKSFKFKKKGLKHEFSVLRNPETRELTLLTRTKERGVQIRSELVKLPETANDFKMITKAKEKIHFGFEFNLNNKEEYQIISFSSNGIRLD